MHDAEESSEGQIECRAVRVWTETPEGWRIAVVWIEVSPFDPRVQSGEAVQYEGRFYVQRETLVFRPDAHQSTSGIEPPKADSQSPE